MRLALLACVLLGLPPGAAAQPAPGHRVVAVRLPTWDIAAVTSLQGLVGETTPLLPQEIEEAKKILGDCVDYSIVRVGVAKDGFLDFPTTWGNIIRIPAGLGLPKATLIHELIHVWQFQTGGSAYVSDSLLHQAASLLKQRNRDAAYDYALVPGKRFIDYAAEQQAQIVEDYYAYPAKRKDPAYQVLVDQLKKIKAVRQGATMFLERDAGLPPRGKELPPVPGFEPPRDGAVGAIPQLELRFNLF